MFNVGPKITYFPNCVIWLTLKPANYSTLNILMLEANAALGEKSYIINKDISHQKYDIHYRVRIKYITAGVINPSDGAFKWCLCPAACST